MVLLGPDIKLVVEDGGSPEGDNGDLKSMRTG